MMTRKTIVTFALRMVIAALPQSYAHGSSGRMTPFEATIDLVRTNSGELWSAHVLSASGTSKYRIWLDPEYIFGHKYLFAVNLVLNRNDGQKPDSNILWNDPSEASHGPQPFSFVANDFAKGPQNTSYGADRTVTLPHEGLVVRIKVLDAAVSLLPEEMVNRIRDKTPQVDNMYQLETLRLAVSVDNLVK